MPALVGDKQKDYCHACFNGHLKKDISNKAFRLRVGRLRCAEKKAIETTEEMDHTPIGSIVFSSWKKLKANAKGDTKRLLEKLGESNYRKLVIQMNEGILSTPPDPSSDLNVLASQTLQDVIDLTNSARKALGKHDSLP